MSNSAIPPVQRHCCALGGVTDNLFGLFARGTLQRAVGADNLVGPAGYIRQLEVLMQQILQRIAGVLQRDSSFMVPAATLRACCPGSMC